MSWNFESSTILAKVVICSTSRDFYPWQTQKSDEVVRKQWQILYCSVTVKNCIVFQELQYVYNFDSRSYDRGKIVQRMSYKYKLEDPTTSIIKFLRTI